MRKSVAKLIVFHSRSINNKINRSHERILRIVYSNFKSSFRKRWAVSIHVKNLQIFATEMFKISKKFSVPLMIELFQQKVNHYDLQNPYVFFVANVTSVSHGQSSISYLSPLKWQLAPSDSKDLNTVSAFKAAIKKWKPNTYPCRLCKTYRKCWFHLNYLFGVHNRRREECGFFHLVLCLYF